MARNITYTPSGAEQTLENGCASSSGQEQGCTDTLETYVYNNRLQPVMIELGTPTNASADYCLVYNYYTNVGNPTSCAIPAQATSGNNGNVMDYAYLDNQTTLSPNLSHTATYAYDSLNRLSNAQASGQRRVSHSRNSAAFRSVLMAMPRSNKTTPRYLTFACSRGWRIDRAFCDLCGLPRIDVRIEYQSGVLPFIAGSKTLRGGRRIRARLPAAPPRSAKSTGFSRCRLCAATNGG